MAPADDSAAAIQSALRRYVHERQRFLADVCRRHNMSRSEFDALDELSRHGGLTPGELGERLSLTSGSITSLIDRLEGLGWATRERHETDRRKVIVRLTEKATAIGSEEIGPLVLAVEATAAAFAAKDRAAIARFLDGAADALSQAHHG